MRQRFTLSLIREYLESKIVNDDYTDELYGLYLEIQQHGKDAIEPNRRLISKIIKNIRKEMEE